MRRRSTFIPSPGIDYDPSEVKINGQKLSFAGLDAAREEKLTLGLKDLPREIVEVLEKSHELHVRWVSEEKYQKSTPYLSSLTSGLHVHYTPLDGTREDDEGLCHLLKKLFSPSLQCSTTEDSFSRPHIISERFASGATLQYYSVLPSTRYLAAYIQRNICKSSDVVCTHSAALLNIASYIDIDYDALSHTLSLTTYWSKPPEVLMDPVGEWTTYNHWNLAINGSPADRNEVGILRPSTELSPAASPGEVQMEGFLTVLGQDDTPKPTLFSFPSRHQSLPASQAQSQQYTISFDQPTGLHPTLRISFPKPSPSHPALLPPTNRPTDSTCALHTYLTLPSVLFPDQYAFPPQNHPDPLFTSAHNILTLHSLSGETDLEIPDYATQKWGSAMLLELATPTDTHTNSSTNTDNSPWEITIPLHLRYLPPSTTGHRTVTIPHPLLFWACTADDGTKFPVNPFDRVNLGYDALFGPRTMFFHLEPSNSQTRLVEEIKVPVLNEGVVGFEGVEWMTGALVMGGFLYVAVLVLRGIIGGTGREDTSASAKAKQTDKNVKKVQ